MIVSKLMKHKVIDGFEITGSDIIDIISKNKDLEINIKNSVITGGLDFTRLPTISLEQITLPNNWSEEKRNHVEQILRNLKEFHMVTNKIIIEDTRIEVTTIDEANRGPIVNAENTFFHGGVDFSGTTFMGEANFNNATFNKEVFFCVSTFTGKVSFDFTKFLPFTLDIIPENGGGEKEANNEDAAEHADNTIVCTKESSKKGRGKDKGVDSAASLSEGVDFSQVTFGDDVSFVGSLYGRDVRFEGSTFSGKANFNNTVFREKTSFFLSTFEGEAKFEKTQFRGEADFVQATFEGEALFMETKFANKRANFYRTIFNNNVEFYSVTFNGKANFKETLFSGPIDFYNSVFNGEAIFNNTDFKNTAYFMETTFKGDASFGQADFIGEANFGMAKFCETLYFNETNFSKLAYFKEAQFYNVLSIMGPRFQKYADFRSATVRKLHLGNRSSPTIVDNRFDFRNAEILQANIQEIVFLQDVNFSHAKFGLLQVEASPKESGMDKGLNGNPTAGPADNERNCPNDSANDSAKEEEAAAKHYFMIFHDVTFEADAYFIETEFFGQAILDNVIFEQEANFSGATFKTSKEKGELILFLSHVTFNNLQIKWDQLREPMSWVKQGKSLPESWVGDENLIEFFGNGDETELEMLFPEKEKLSEVFKKLEIHFHSHNELNDANDAHYHRKISELAEARKGGTWLEQVQSETVGFSWGLFFGYGTNLGWAASWSLFWYLTFGVIFYAKGNFVQQSDPENSGLSSFLPRPLGWFKEYLTTVGSKEKNNQNFKEIPTKHRLKNAALLSLVLLLRVGYKDRTISGKLRGIDLKYFVFAEWILGIFWVVGLVFTLKNTFPVFNAVVAFLL